MSKKILIRFLMLFILVAQAYKISSAQNIDKSGQTNSAQAAAVLSASDKAQLTEALRLKAEFGDQVWPGFGSSAIPIILYNDSYEFLFGEENPVDTWGVVKEDNFMGRPYYRRAAKNPQSFAVSIGTRWAGRIGTLEWMNSKSPFKMTADFLIVGLLHELFHAYQANMAPARFARATAVYKSESRYPYKDSDFASDWNNEGKTLAEALRAKDDAEARSLAQKFLQIRDARRERATLNPDLVAYEAELEWLEGLAQYVEIRFYELAASNAKESASIRYGPGLPFYLQWDFVRLERFMSQQSGDLRFYLSGMAQARLLDRLNPGWKAKAMQEKVYLEDLLGAVVEPEKKSSISSSGRVLDFDFEDALEGKAEDYGQSEIDDKPVDMPSKKIHISGGIKNFDGFYRQISRQRRFSRIEKLSDKITPHFCLRDFDKGLLADNNSF